MFTDTPENYKARIKALPGLIGATLRQLPRFGPCDEDQLALIRQVTAEISELLHWKVYNDSYSRDSTWLFLNHLGLTGMEARFAIIAFDADPSLRETALGEAFKAYLQQVKKGTRSDDFVAGWLRGLESRSR